MKVGKAALLPSRLCWDFQQAAFPGSFLGSFLQAASSSSKGIIFFWFWFSFWRSPGILVRFHLQLLRFRINAVRGIVFLRLLFVLVALLLVGGLFHRRLDGGSFLCVA